MAGKEMKLRRNIAPHLVFVDDGETLQVNHEKIPGFHLVFKSGTDRTEAGRACMKYSKAFNELAIYLFRQMPEEIPNDWRKMNEVGKL